MTEPETTETERETTELAFDVDAALLVELGERLVARRSVALAELIKNAYDADATEAIISFENITGPHGSIVVLDNGSGMTLEAMKRGWMRIATNDATVNARSAKYGRPRTGAKGVGRFACGRLASRLSLESTSIVPGGSERVTAEFNWRDFEPGKDLSDVVATITREMVAEDLPTGTTLRLSGLVDSWTGDDLGELQTELDDLMNLEGEEGSVLRDPDFEADPGFEAHILAPEFPRFEGRLGEPFNEAAWGLLTGSLTEHSQPQYKLEIIDSGTHLRHVPSDRTFDALAGVTFTIRMMVYQGRRFRGTGFNLAEARAFGRRRGGVRIYLDGFQVFSYGSPGDDWLDLDQHRARRQAELPEWLTEEAYGLGRPMLSLPGNMQLFGAVTLSREQNPGLVVGISRERLVQNDTYEQLKQFVRGGIDWMTVCYAREQARTRDANRADQGDRLTAAQAVAAALEIIDQEAGIPESTKRITRSVLNEAVTLLAQEAETHISELAMLRVLASAGTTVMVLDHTLRTLTAQLDDIVDRLESSLSEAPSDGTDGLGQALGDLRSWAAMATGQGKLVGLLVGQEARTQRDSHALRPFVETLKRGFAGYTNRFGIALENGVPARLRTPPLHEAEVYAVLLNLLTNSFKAVRDLTERRVRVEAEATREQFKLRVLDTGVGVPPENREDVFEPFFTTSQPDPVLGVGTGLGLKIVRDLALAWGGDARFVDAAEPWSTSIEIVVPRRGRS